VVSQSRLLQVILAEYRAAYETPPVARSNSAIPEDRPGVSVLLPVKLSGSNRPLRLERIKTGMMVAPVTSCSTSVFHAQQDSHCPASSHSPRRKALGDVGAMSGER
jgi:hypothetical protein